MANREGRNAQTSDYSSLSLDLKLRPGLRGTVVCALAYLQFFPWKLSDQIPTVAACLCVSVSSQGVTEQSTLLAVCCQSQYERLNCS